MELMELSEHRYGPGENGHADEMTSSNTSSSSTRLRKEPAWLKHRHTSTLSEVFERLSSGATQSVSWLNSEQENERQLTVAQRCKELLTSKPFEVFLALTILANALILGVQADDPSREQDWYTVEDFFLAIFSFELVLRFVTVGPTTFFYLRESEFWPNMLDLTIVFLGITECVARYTIGEGWGKVAVYIRMLRLLRILRLFNLVRFLKQLYMLTHGILEASTAVFWVMILMASILYVVSIVLVRAFGQQEADSLGEEEESRVILVEQFGTIGRSMLTLFRQMSFPDLGEYRDAKITEAEPFLTWLLVIWIIFGNFGTISLLTGVVSEALFEKAQLRIQEERHQEELKLKILSDRCSELFDAIETATEGKALKMELVCLIPYIEKVLKMSSVTFTDADLRNAFTLMDTDDDGCVRKTEFLQSILSIAERSRAMTNNELQYAMSYVKTKLAKCEPIVEQGLQQTESLLLAQENSKNMQRDNQQSIERMLDAENKTKAKREACNAIAREVRARATQVQADVLSLSDASARMETYCKTTVGELKDSLLKLQRDVARIGQKVQQELGVEDPSDAAAATDTNRSPNASAMTSPSHAERT